MRRIFDDFKDILGVLRRKVEFLSLNYQQIPMSIEEEYKLNHIFR